MELDRYTLKSREAIERAQRIARDRSHQELQPEHLLASLLQETEGTMVAVLQKHGIQPTALMTAVDEQLKSLPRVSGAASGLYLGESLRAVFERAEAQAERLKDDFVSVEHLLLALADPAAPGPAQRLLAKQGVTAEAVLKALATVRGGQRVTDEKPEDKYQSLTKCGRDLTQKYSQWKIPRRNGSEYTAPVHC